MALKKEPDASYSFRLETPTIDGPGARRGTRFKRVAGFSKLGDYGKMVVVICVLTGIRK